MAETPRRLRFGILCNGPVFQRWQADALRLLMEQGHQPGLLIVDGRKSVVHNRLRRILRKKRRTLLFSFLENRLFKPVEKQTVDLAIELAGVESMVCLVERKGYSEFFGAADVEAINRHHLDFMLRFGFNIIRGEILTATRYGVWSFHHDDEMKYRGGPPGFWEIFRSDPVSAAMMQQLTERLDGGIILAKGYLKTVRHSYRGNLGQLLRVSSSWPAQVARRLSALTEEEFPGEIKDLRPQRTTEAPILTLPSNIVMIRFLFLLFLNRIKLYYRDLFCAEIWNVGIINKPIHEVAFSSQPINKDEVAWLPKLVRSGYLADPSGFIIDGKVHILVEEYRYRIQKAGISMLHPVRVPDPVRVLDASIHLSYPYVIEYQGELYCVPEASRSSAITLYRRNKASGVFEKERVLVAGVEAVDPTLFYYQGFWWLFFTDQENSNTRLSVYFAPALDGEFKPHRNNPVKIDIRSARPAGTPFIRDQVLYRPAQDSSMTYGGRIAINRVLQLTPDTFAEETLHYIAPVANSRFNKGLHTISGVDNMTFIDGKTYRFNHWNFWHQLRNKLGRKEKRDV